MLRWPVFNVVTPVVPRFYLLRDQGKSAASAQFNKNPDIYFSALNDLGPVSLPGSITVTWGSERTG